jgi:flagellar biosynthesis protein FlhF
LPVLVDTPGLSPANEEAAAIFTALAGLAGVTTHLVVPAATSPRDFDRIWTRFEAVRPTCVVVTKVDETETVMPLVRRLREQHLRISLLGTGQQVPQDLAHATADAIAACLLGQAPRTEAE